METLLGKVSTHIRRKVNELIAGYNTNVTSIATNTSNLALLVAGNVGEHVTALGTNAATAAALSATKFIHRVLAADATVGVILPVGTVGAVHVVINVVNNTLKIYPATGEKIDGGTASAAITGTALYTYIFTYKDASEGWDSAKFLVA
jgi:hypothetical protein